MISAPPRPLPALLAALAVALTLGLTVLPPSTSRILAWPWVGFAAAGWLLVLAVVLRRLASAAPSSRFGGPLDAGLALLALVAVLSSFASPVGAAVRPHLLPFLGACALPYVLLPWIQSAPALRRFLAVSTALVVLVLAASLGLWLAAGNLAARNAQPFGHSNTTGSVAVLAATWCAYAACQLSGRLRLLAASGVALALATALSSQSRGAVLALAAATATAAAIPLLLRRRYLACAALALLIVCGALASNARLRELALHGRWNTSDQESNRQRTAMILGGVALGAERPLLGWGAGSVPHVFPRVRAPLPGTADNFVHLHNTPAQLFATIGVAGLLAALLLVAGVVARLRAAPWTPARACLAAGLVGAATVLLFDHPFATPVFALLAAAHLAAWAAPANPPRPLRPAGWLGLLLVLLALVPATRDLAARAAYTSALDAGDRNDALGYRTNLARAAALAPADPYFSHQYASHLFGGAPVINVGDIDPPAAIPLLRPTLLANPDLEYARYNLGWLLLDADPAASAAEFLAAARLAPQRGGVYHGLALARLRTGDPAAALRALATECLHDPSFFWSPHWQSPELASLRPLVLAALQAAPLPASARATALRQAWSLKLPPLADAPRYRRVRTGYGVLLGHPDGPAPVDVNIQFKVTLPPELAPLVPPKGWLPGPWLLNYLDAP